MNKSILKIQRTHIIALIVILLLQSLPLFFISKFLDSFIADGSVDIPDNIRTIGFSLFGSLMLIIDLWFCYKKIFLLNKLCNVRPIECVIEDFLLVGHTHDGRREYSIYPIIRSMLDNNLYLAYGDDALSRFNTIQSYSGHELVDFHVRSDGKELHVGDKVNMYMLKTLNAGVDVDIPNYKLLIGKTKIPFNHTNHNLKITECDKIILFQGVVAPCQI